MVVSTPLKKYWSKWESSPNRGENKKYLKPPSSLCVFGSNNVGQNATFVEGSSEFFLTHEPEGESHDFSSISHVVRTGMSGRSGLDFLLKTYNGLIRYCKKKLHFFNKAYKSPH